MTFDPTRTTTLRRNFERDLRRRFKRVEADLKNLVVDRDVFGLEATSIFQSSLLNEEGYYYGLRNITTPSIL